MARDRGNLIARAHAGRRGRPARDDARDYDTSGRERPEIYSERGAAGAGRHVGRWRWFYTQQHGDNPTYEVLLTRGAGHDTWGGQP